jgi:hypothetical protein
VRVPSGKQPPERPDLRVFSSPTEEAAPVQDGGSRSQPLLRSSACRLASAIASSLAAYGGQAALQDVVAKLPRCSGDGGGHDVGGALYRRFCSSGG